MTPCDPAAPPPAGVQETAAWLAARRLGPIRLRPRTKKMYREDDSPRPDAPAEFAPNDNIGVVNGTPGGNLIDVDIETPEAVAAAGVLLPATGLKWGRPRHPRSHWAYRVARPPEKAKVEFRDPTRGRPGRTRAT